MNTEIVLTDNQEANRIQDGLKVYNNGLIEQIDSRRYLVKGKYIVEDLTTKDDIEPFYRCSCADHQYRGVQCKHINGVVFYQLSLVNNGA